MLIGKLTQTVTQPGFANCPFLVGVEEGFTLVLRVLYQVKHMLFTFSHLPLLRRHKRLERLL